MSNKTRNEEVSKNILKTVVLGLEEEIITKNDSLDVREHTLYVTREKTQVGTFLSTVTDIMKVVAQETLDDQLH